MKTVENKENMNGKKNLEKYKTKYIFLYSTESLEIHWRLYFCKQKPELKTYKC